MHLDIPETDIIGAQPGPNTVTSLNVLGQTRLLLVIVVLGCSMLADDREVLKTHRTNVHAATTSHLHLMPSNVDEKIQLVLTTQLVNSVSR